MVAVYVLLALTVVVLVTAYVVFRLIFHSPIGTQNDDESISPSEQVDPLRETIMQQTGRTEQERIDFLRMMDRRAIGLLVHRWDTPQRAAATF